MDNMLNVIQYAGLQGPFSSQEQSDAWIRLMRKHSQLIWQSIYRTFQAVSFYHEQEDVENVFRVIFRSLLKKNFDTTGQFHSINGRTLSTWFSAVSANHAIEYVRSSCGHSQTITADPSSDTAAMQQLELHLSFFRIAAYLDNILTSNEKDAVDRYLCEHPERRSTIAVIRRVLFDRNLDQVNSDVPQHLIDTVLKNLPEVKRCA